MTVLNTARSLTSEALASLSFLHQQHSHTIMRRAAYYGMKIHSGAIPGCGAPPVATMRAASSTSSSKGGGLSSSIGKGMSSSDWVCCGRGAFSCLRRSHSKSRNLRELALLGSNSRHLSAWMMALHAQGHIVGAR